MDWTAWQQRWDAQQQAYLPDREERFTAVLDAVEAACGRAPRVLDLAGGTGSITRRVLARFPAATSTVLDVDAALLAIARGTFAGDPRVRVCSADLATPGWLEQLGEPGGSIDAVLTATALHWLTPERVAGVYAEATSLLRSGGVLVNTETIPDPGLASLAGNSSGSPRTAARSCGPPVACPRGRSGGRNCAATRCSPALPPNGTNTSDTATPRTPRPCWLSTGTSRPCVTPGAPRRVLCGGDCATPPYSAASHDPPPHRDTLNGTGTRNPCLAGPWDDAPVEGFTSARAGLPRCADGVGGRLRRADRAVRRPRAGQDRRSRPPARGYVRGLLGDLRSYGAGEP